MPVWEADDVLSLDEVATALRLDRRTVRRVAFQLGGKRFGRRWRFRWGTVMEFFNAHETQEPGELLAGACRHRRPAGGQQGFPSGPQQRPGVDGGQDMGGRAKKRKIMLL